MENVMLDLETMGAGSNAAIVAIGAVEFDIETQTLGDSFYSTIDLESSVKSGGAIDASTVKWWLGQSDEARKEITSSQQTSIALALPMFSSWLKTCAGQSLIKIWGNGASFDNVILANTYQRLNIELPWQFRNDRCYRTVKNLNKDIPMPLFEGVRHTALSDAKNQAIHLLSILKAKK